MTKAKMQKLAKIQRQQTIDLATLFEPMIEDLETAVEHLKLFTEHGPNMPGSNEARAAVSQLEQGFLGTAKAYINAAETYREEDAAAKKTAKATPRKSKTS